MSDVVVITGASGGIGRATARSFAQDGAKIALLARGRAGLEAAAKEVEELGGRALVLPTDVADPDQVEAAAKAAEDELGPIDVWINDAMATIYGEFLDIEPDEFRRATDVTYHGLVWGTRAALTPDEGAEPRHDRPGRLGARLPRHPAAGAVLRREAAGKNFTESVITEIKHHGWDIHVSMVHLAALQHDPVHMGPDEAAEADTARAADLPAGDRRRRDPLGGTPPAARRSMSACPTVLNILGERVAPWFLDWYLAKTGYGSQMTDAAARSAAGARQPLRAGGRRRGPRLARPVRRRGARAQLPDDADEAPPARRLTRGRGRRRDGRRAAAEALALALRDRAQQLGSGRAEAVGVLLLEHGAESADLAGAERRLARLERAAEEQREVAVARRDAGAGSGPCGKPTHELGRDGNGLAVEAELDRLLAHPWSMAQNPGLSTSLRAERVHLAPADDVELPRHP